MFHTLPRAGFYCAFMVVIAVSSVWAQENESRSIYQFGGFKLGVINTQEEAVATDNACEISIAVNCDGEIPFIGCLPQLVNLFGSVAEEDPQVIVVANSCDEKCCQGLQAKQMVCESAECTEGCATPAITIQGTCPAGSCKSSCCASTDTCSAGSSGSCCAGSQIHSGIQVSQLVTNEIPANCATCPHRGSSDGSVCCANSDQVCRHDEKVRLVSHVATSSVNGPTQQQLMSGLMEARVENARLQMQIEAMKHHCEMIEEMTELRARNELLEEMAELRTQNVELQVRLEMQERHHAMTPQQPMHSRVGIGTAAMPQLMKARAVRISTPQHMQNVILTGSPEFTATPLTPKCTDCPNCPHQNRVESEQR